VPATGLADFGAADPQPAVPVRGEEHRGEERAVGGLDRGASGE